MINYLFEASVCLVLFYLLYALLLSKAYHFNAKRVYLLSAILLSVLIPALHFTYTASSLPDWAELSTITSTQEITKAGPISVKTPFTLINLLSLIYLLGCLIMSIRLIQSIIKIIKTIRKGKVVKKEHYNLVYTDNQVSLSSFFNYIFINVTDHPDEDELKSMLSHEEKHVRDLHSIDVIILELTKIVFWFNPVIYFINHSLRAQHEFICDREVTKTLPREDYERILIKSLFRQVDTSLLSPFNHLPIKNRINMIYQQKTSKLSFLKFFTILPLITLLTFTFSCEESGSANVELESSLGLTKTIKGKVLSAETGKPLPGINIVVKGARIGTVTDITGNYQLEVPNEYNELTFSFIGFESQSLEIGTHEVIDVSLVEDMEFKKSFESDN